MAELLRKSIYNCKACGCFFSRNAKLQQHMTTHTPEENMLYGDIFTYYLTSIKNEVCAQRPKPKITCLLCPKMYVYKWQHKKHLMSVHGVIEKLSPTPSDIIRKVNSGQKNKDCDGREIVKPPDSSAIHMAKNENKVHYGLLTPEHVQRGTKRGKPPKERCHITQLPVGDVDGKGRGKAPDIGPQNPEQDQRVTKRGRPPKERCDVTQLPVGDVGKRERVKALDIRPLNPKQEKTGKKRGRPPKERSLKQLSVSDVNEQSKVSTKRGRPHEGSHVKQLPVRDVNEMGRVKEPGFKPLNLEPAKRGSKRGRPPKERYHNKQLSISDVDERGRVKPPDFEPMNPEQAKRGRKRERPPEERCHQQLSVSDVDEQAKKSIKRGRPPKGSSHITQLPVRDDERERVKALDIRPLNPKQEKTGRKRGRPPKERSLKQLSVSDVNEQSKESTKRGRPPKAGHIKQLSVSGVNENGRVKEPDYKPLNPEQAKRGAKRGRPPKERCLEQLSVSHVDEPAKSGRKRGRPPKGKCHIKQLPVRNDEGGRVKAPECSRNIVVKNEKKVHCGPQSSKQAKRREKENRPFKKYYECRECKKRLTQSSSLTAHMRIHTGERPYQCLLCSKTYTFYQCLWNHSWLHKKTNSFPCDKCPKKFRYYQSLWTHYKTHSGKKLFKCTTCKLGFTTSVQLSHHEKKHSQKKGGDLNKNKKNRRYLRTKVKEMQFKCEVCLKEFRLKISLVSHKEKCNLKRQLSFKMSRKNKEASKTLPVTGAGLGHKQKGNERSREFVKPKVERSVFVNFQTSKGGVRKQHDTCPVCKNVYTNCVCRVKCKGKNKNKNLPKILPPSSKRVVRNQRCHFDYKNKMASSLHTHNKRSRCGSKKTAEAKLSMSKRLKREEPVVLECEKYDQLYSCLHCSKSFQSLSCLSRHQNSAHIDPQEEMFHINKLKTPQNGKKHRRRSLERKCSCCGTVFISNDEYKKHIAGVSCVCGQHFQCAYIFCFHTSTCGERSVSVEEEMVDQKSKEASVSHTIEEDFSCQQHVGQPHSNALLCGSMESNQMSADSVSPVLNTSDSVFPPSSDHNQAEAWFWQLINEDYTGEIDINEIIPQAMPDDLVEVGEDPWHAREIPWGSEEEYELHSDQEADEQIEISSKLPGNKQRFQCIICSEQFLLESDLASHSLSHLTVGF